MKPAEETPWSTGQIADLAVEAGLPAGVLNLVQGDDATGRALVAAGVDGVAFTGSAEAGHAIARELHARRPYRPLVAEMGGKNPAIVTTHADLDRAAEGIVRSAYGLSGQKCSSCSRVVVDASCTTSWWSGSPRARRGSCVGDPADPATTLGPVVGPDATAASTPRSPTPGATARSWPAARATAASSQPTLVTGLPHGHRLTREELFLPFLTVTAVDSFDAAMDEANAVEYGLTAGIFSEDAAEQRAFLERIEAGVVFVNRREGATTGAWPGIQTFPAGSRAASSGKGGLGPHYLTQFMREQSRTVMVS